ncbi:MAG: SpoIID/LytB domain-containing protein [Phycisphaeraceae bacterium]|nr:SpoIID/LytB domain-containing protein [Phycisphaeraceae bacterium]
MTSPRLVLPALIVLLFLVVACRHSSTHTHRGHRTHKPTTYQTDRSATEARLTAKRGPLAVTVHSEPMLRIRIGRGLSATTLSSPTAITVGPGVKDTGKARPYTFQPPLRIKHDGQGFVLTEPDGKSVRWRLNTLEVRSKAGNITIDKNPYPGRIELVAQTNKANQLTGTFDTVNHVGMESYLPGVLSKELYPNWDLKAYRAQAIAARSYAIWEMNLPIRKNSHFDLEASQASQAYIGAKASDKARTAVADTAGQVLVFEGRVLPAFYSSCSGGVGQDAIAAWPKKVDDLAPLQGRAHGGWGQASTKFRWGPITRDRATLSKRIAAWGKVNQHAIAAMGQLAAVQTAKINKVRRPTKLRVTDTAGQSFDMNCEDLRMATNFPAGSLPKVDMSNMVFSSHAVYTVAGDTVTITGQGFGHGVGLCQFGAQHMASTGNRHDKILGFYYPGARIQKAY